MKSNVLTFLYIATGVFALFFGNVMNDLLALGVRSEYVNIGEKLVTALLIFFGLALQQMGVTPPALPKEEE